MQRFLHRRLLAASLLALPGAVHAQDKPPVILTPASAWNVNYADDSCRLGRTFADGDGQAVFYIDQFEPGATMTVLVASKAFRNYAGDKVATRFGPSGTERTIDRVFDVTFGKIGPAIMINGMSLVDSDPATSVSSSASPSVAPTPDDSALVELKEATPEQAQAITWYEVQRGSRAPIRFALGPMRAPMAALRACAEELLTHWGIDVAAHRTLSKRPVPASSPGSWVTSRDYPSGLAQMGAQGLVQFRVVVDERGRVASCHIQQSTRPVGFDEAVCKAISREGRFEPALDAAGRPIKSFWRSSVRFVMPG